MSKNKRLCTADGKPMHLLGTVNLTLDIHDFEIPVIFLRFITLQFNVILGVQFLTQTKANIDMEGQTLTFYNDLAGTNLSDDRSDFNSAQIWMFDSSYGSARFWHRIGNNWAMC